MIAYLLLIFAIPLGFFLSSLTKDEKKIYSKPPYFPLILWALAIISAIFFTLDEKIALTTTFMFLTIFFWNKA